MFRSGVCVACALAMLGFTLQLAAQETMPYVFHSLQIGGGGFISGVLFHPSVKGLAYVRTDIGGAYRWDEAAGRWTSLGDWVPMEDANLLGIESLAVDPAHPDDLYLAAGTYISARTPNGALLRSHDRGMHFDIVRLPFKLGGNEPGRFAGERLALDGTGTMYLGTRSDGLWRSRDGGSTWQAVTSLQNKGAAGLGVLFVLQAAGVRQGTHTLYAGWLIGSTAYTSRTMQESPGDRYPVHLRGCSRTELLPQPMARSTSHTAIRPVPTM